MSSKLAFLMDGSGEGKLLGSAFSWKEMHDGTWEFSNGEYPGRGHFIVVSYAGAAGRQHNAAQHELRVGYTMGVKDGRCWKICAEAGELAHFDFSCQGIAQGWFEDSDGVFVQISGVVRGIGSKWTAGSKVYVPQLYGKPEQTTKPRRSGGPLGIALNETDLLLTPHIL
mgnify:CR=1 FL=1